MSPSPARSRFAAGETPKTISVDGQHGDKVAELNETLSRLSAPTGAKDPAGTTHGRAILTDEAIVPIDRHRGRHGEGRRWRDARPRFHRDPCSQATTNPVTVTYGTADGTAKAGQDYIAQTGTLTFAPGETSEVINVKVTGDTAIEGNETLKIYLTATTGGKIADQQRRRHDHERRCEDFRRQHRGDGGKQRHQRSRLHRHAVRGDLRTGHCASYCRQRLSAKAGQDYVAQTGTLTFCCRRDTQEVDPCPGEGRYGHRGQQKR